MSENSYEIDFVELLKQVFLNRIFIFKRTILALVLGIIYALFQPNVFTASTTFIPQLSSEISSGSSQISGLASLAGINLGGSEGSSELPPTLYPKVVESIPFKLELLSSIIKIDNKELTLRDYILINHSPGIFSILKKYTIGMPSLVLSYFKNKKNHSENITTIYNVSEEDDKLFKIIDKVFSLSVNEKEGFISMSFSDHDKNVSAQITLIAQTLLQEKIIQYKVQSSKELLSFTLRQYDENKEVYEMLQDERAIFIDKNQNISSTLFQNKLNRIESELGIAQTVVQQLASQVEQAKLQVNKDTPVFTTIKPVTIPFERNSPNRALIAITFFFVGFLFSCLYLFIKEPTSEIIKSIKS